MNLLATAAAAALVAAVGAPGVADGQPTPPPNPSDSELSAGRDQARSAAERVGTLANELATAVSELDRAQIDLAVAFESATAAEQQLADAQAARQSAQDTADTAAAVARGARDEVEQARADLDAFAAGSYRQGSTVGSLSAFLGADDPADLMARAELLDAVSGSQLDALDAVRRARATAANADSEAREALEAAATAEAASADAQVQAAAAYSAAVAAEAEEERRTAELEAERTALEGELAVAQEELRALEGRREDYDDWQEARAAEERAAAAAARESTAAAPGPPPAPAPSPALAAVGLRSPGATVAPTTGRVTSTYGARWGTIHYGLDIANRIGTPVLAAQDGTVISSGPASGFGLWVRLRHANGTVTVYGHIDRTLVAVGQRVVAGEQIATVGNRGQSTGPHLHFEVHLDGSRKVDPQAWLRRNGVTAL